MKVFHFSYYDTWAFGNFEEKEIIVIANTSDEALGMVLMKFPQTASKHWSGEEITMTPGVLTIHEKGS